MACVFLFSYFVLHVFSISLSASLSKPWHYVDLNKSNGGFTISLIHRDSAQSPFYNHSMTTYDRRVEAAGRSIHRAQHLVTLSGANAVSAKVIPDGYSEYIATFYIGTPPTKVSAIVDTGSGLNWVKGPAVYDPNKSSSYKKRFCLGSCPSLGFCNRATDLCSFNLTYADGSTTSGIFSYEDFGFDDANGGSTVVGVPNLLFGYATQSTGFELIEDGFLALNQRPWSFISQLHIKKFSHCFVIDDVHQGGRSSRMYFGTWPMTSDYTIPLEPNTNGLYYVTLNGISVGDALVEVPPGAFEFDKARGRGGVLLDTGTSFTLLVPKAYGGFKSEMGKHMKRPLVKPVRFFDFCFNGTYDNLRDLPIVTFHFASTVRGEEIKLRLARRNTYVEASVGVLCLAILPSKYGESVIGNIAMRNLWVGYDLERQQISLLPLNCSAS